MRVGETFCDSFIERIFKNQFFAKFDKAAKLNQMMLIIVEDGSQKVSLATLMTLMHK